MRLRERLGTGYASVGFLLHEGTYRAAPDPGKPRQTIAAPVSPVGPGFAAEAFGRVGKPIYAVDLRAAPAGPVRDWLAAPHRVHSYGWIVPDPRYQALPRSLTRGFDVVVYVKRTTAARRLETAAPAPKDASAPGAR
jgi:erythromycin esterase